MTIAELQTKVEQARVKGFLANDEAAALYSCADIVSNFGPVLEIGSYCGKSSIFLGAACKLQQSILFSVDHHRGSEEHQWGEEYHDSELFDHSARAMDSFPTFRRNIDLFNLSDVIVPIVASSRLTVKAWATPLAMVFIDGGHSHAMAMEDCISWSQHVRSGGVLAIHDVFENPDEGGQGPYLAMTAVLAGGDFDVREKINSLAILVRR